MRTQEAPMVDLPAVPVIDLSLASGDELVAGLERTSCVFLSGLGSVISEAEAVVSRLKRLL
jgi:hypothetical protein